MERDEWTGLMEPVAKELLGEPNRNFSTKTELRYGSRGSISVDLEKGTFFDFETNEGGGVAALIARETKGEPGAWLRERGYAPDDKPRRPNGGGNVVPIRRIVKTFNYCDVDDTILFQVVRYDPKDFRQRRPDASKPDGWNWSTKGVKQVPYMLPRLQEPLSDGLTVYIVEGEKVVDLMWSLNLPATCNAGGAGKWSPALTPHFAGADVVIIPDYDPQKKNPKTGELMFHVDGRPILPGQDHALDIARELSEAETPPARVRVLDLALVWRTIKPKNDFYDWYQTAKTLSSDPVAQFNLLVERAPDWSPELVLEYPGSQQSINEWNAGAEPSDIPPRQWLLGTEFCRQYISSIVAAGGTGKSALRLLQFVSMAIGRPLSGQYVFRRSRVLLISLEDDTEELQRRLKAVLLFYNINRAELDGWLYCASPKQLKLAVMQNRVRMRGDLEARLREAIQRVNPDLISLDPFVKTHALEENSSGDMDFVCDLLAQMGVEFNIAVDSPHHVHKGTVEPGNADAGRGSSGIRDAARLVSTLCSMTEEEAERFNVKQDERRYYVRLDPAKVNIAAPPQRATWFRLKSVNIGNATTDYPNGDTVQVAEPWEPDTPFSNTSRETLNKILDVIAGGMDDGKRRYSNAPRATDRAVWPVVQQFCPDKNEGQCRTIINSWLDSKLLIARDYYNEVRRAEEKGLYVDDSKRP